MNIWLNYWIFQWIIENFLNIWWNYRIFNLIIEYLIELLSFSWIFDWIIKFFWNIWLNYYVFLEYLIELLSFSWIFDWIIEYLMKLLNIWLNYWIFDRISDEWMTELLCKWNNCCNRRVLSGNCTTYGVAMALRTAWEAVRSCPSCSTRLKSIRPSRKSSRWCTAPASGSATPSAKRRRRSRPATPASDRRPTPTTSSPSASSASSPTNSRNATNESQCPPFSFIHLLIYHWFIDSKLMI